MSYTLSLADRDNLLNSIRTLSSEEVDTESLLLEASKWAENLGSQYGYEHALVRNIAELSNHLRIYSGDDDFLTIARGAILFVIRGGTNQPIGRLQADFDPFETIGKTYVASYAVHEISTRLGNPVTFSPPAITQAEQAAARTLLDELSNVSGCDTELVKSAEQKLLDIRDIVNCGFLYRFLRHTQTLISVLRDRQGSLDELVYARAALRYFVEDNDAICDDLGLVGYLDDAYIMQLAVDLVSPLREPLVELTDRAVEVWPFLNMLTLDDGSGVQAVSEFLILNSALSCRDLRNADSLGTLLITPETGPLAILIGVISTLGLAHNSNRRRLTESSFKQGQKVLVDYEAVAEFDGVEEVAERRYFWLKKYNTTQGVKTFSRVMWPIADLYRLVPVDQERAVRGEIQHGKRNAVTELSALNFLFGGSSKVDIHSIEKQIIVVTPATVASEFCKSTRVYGQSIKDVLPIGHIDTEGEATVSWSSSFGTQKPVLIFASDLDIAQTYVELHRCAIEQVIVDVSGRNREKYSALRRLSRFDIPCFLIASERTANETNVVQYPDLSVWEWRSDDLKALTWSRKNSSSRLGMIGQFESRVRSTSSNIAKTELLSLPIVSETHGAFNSLRKLLHDRDSEVPPDLDEVFTNLFYAISRLTRTATPISAPFFGVDEFRENLATIDRQLSTSKFISDEERVASSIVAQLLNKMFIVLQDSNPKFETLERLIALYPKATIYSPDARLISGLQAAFANSGNHVAASITDELDLSRGVIIPGWFRNIKMAAALSPPIANPLVLVLYEAEKNWHKQFSTKRNKMRAQRMGLKGRSTIFPGVRGWKKPKPPSEQEVLDTGVENNIESVQQAIDDGFQRRAHSQVEAYRSEDGVKARLVFFVGNLLGAFTENYRMNVVTHLLDGSLNDDETVSVKMLYAKQLQEGDAVVFRPKTQDLIREVADELLASGVREMSRSWQVPLIEYKQKNELSDDDYCLQLKNAGCNIGSAAMLSWISDESIIAPQKYLTDIPAIARVTGSKELDRNMKSVLSAVKTVRNAHQQKAPRLIAKRVRHQAAKAVRKEQDDEEVITLDGDMILVRVQQVSKTVIPVKYSIANRLVEEGQWQE